LNPSNGNLLFYIGAPTTTTKNLTIWNKNNQAMPNGTNLLGDASSSQAALTVPAPGNPNIYYIFTVGAPSSNNAGFWYYTVDMSADNGLGDVVDGPVDLSNGVNSTSWSEKVTAVKGKECNTFWVISAHQNNFYAYKVDNSGVILSNLVISTMTGFNASDDFRGYLKVSPDGTKLVSGNMQNGTYLFDFNNETGVVSNFNNSSFANRLNVGGDGYGVEFSPSSRRLYVYTGGFQRGAQENLFQFDLTLPTISEINSSRFEVFNYRNTRGALQLGPNGKIYWTSDGDVDNNGNNTTNSISVINKPEELGAACDYSHQSVLVGAGNVNPTQGLPPFISSLLLPIEIIDASTNNTVNNQDLEFCIGQDKTIIFEDVEGSNPSYEWTFNDTTIISTEQNLVLLNLQKTNTGKYSLKIELTDDCGNVTQYNGTFNIEVFDAAVATKPTDVFFCDTDRDGFNAFDLQSDKNSEILNGLDESVFEVKYFLNELDANSGNNPLPNPYTNSTAFSSQTLFARVQNKNAINACFEITNFILSVTDLPIPTQPTPLRICDDLESGSDTDGIINTFLLSSKDSEILGNLDANQYNISYHTSKIGAEANDITTIIDKNNNYSVTNSQTVFIRIENKDNTDCSDADTTLELIVDPLPVIIPAVDLLQCDDDLDRISTINLTEAEISISSNSANETFQYFATEADAIAGTPLVADELRYPVTRNGEAWVRTISSENCYRISKINLEVEAAADVAYNKEFDAVCDDFLQADGTDGALNDDTDGITNFNFSEANAEILAFFPPLLQPDLEISYYETRDDRTAVVNEIADIANYRNINFPSDVARQTIYFKITNKNNNNCSGTGELYLKTNTVPEAENVPDLELCDDAIDGDGTNGIVAYFNLESQTASILGNQNPANFTVSYHLSAADANSGNDAQTSPFANTTRDLQTIFVRVTNNATGCFTDHTSFNVIVNAIPIANFVADLEVCDESSDGSARNGFSQAIDLESQTAGILGTQDATIHAVTYHRSLADAQNGNNPLISPYSNITPNRETIYIRIINKNTQCVNGISNFDVIINPEPTFETISNLSECDTNDDFDDANGIIQTIDLDGKIPEILGASQDPDDFNVTFHYSRANATSGTSAISSPYENSSATETIFVRIQNKKTGCVNDDAFFELIINPLPDFTVTTPQILCLNNLPLNISAKNARAVYSYDWRDQNGNSLGNLNNINITTSGSYTVTATTTNGTNCTRSETIVITESNIATLEPSFVTIIDESNNIGSQNNLSISIDTITNDLGPGDYQFAIINTDDTSRIPFSGFQDEPLFENIEGGIYQIIVNDKNGCSPDTTLLVSVIQFPKFFTPNGDGQNDTWVVKGANKDFYPNSSINIFNRYGKLVAQIPIDSQGWNGTYGGKTLSSDDYWFNITLIPADTSKPTINKKGNFSLLRK
jgi:gliding motility-associated-like protein